MCWPDQARQRNFHLSERGKENVRFNRYGRFEFRDTPCKRAAFARKQQNERNSLPLFAEQIAEEQIGVDEEMETRHRQWDRRQALDRAKRAEDWRRARARLRSYPESIRKELLAFWSRCGYPGDPSYLLTMLHSYDNGRLDMNPPTVKMTEENRKAVDAVIARLLSRNSALPV